jgi:hypothetical protein
MSRWTPGASERAAEIVRLYKAGVRRKDIMAQLRVTAGMVAGALARGGVKGVPGRPRGPQAPRKPAAHRVEKARAPKPPCRRGGRPKGASKHGGYSGFRLPVGRSEKPVLSAVPGEGSRRLAALTKARTAEIIAAAERRLA